MFSGRSLSRRNVKPLKSNSKSPSLFWQKSNLCVIMSSEKRLAAVLSKRVKSSKFARFLRTDCPSLPTCQDENCDSFFKRSGMRRPRINKMAVPYLRLTGGKAIKTHFFEISQKIQRISKAREASCDLSVSASRGTLCSGYF